MAIPEKAFSVAGRTTWFTTLPRIVVHLTAFFRVNWVSLTDYYSHGETSMVM